MAGRSRLTFALFVVLGVGSWVTINGVFAELPLLVDHLPESWSISSYISIAIQAANIGPVIFYLAARSLRSVAAQRRAQHVAVAGIVLACTLACVLMAFFWDHTTVVRGHPRSVALISLCFLSALADCTSSVVFYPFVSQYHNAYLPALNTGAALGGLLASAFSWIQTGFFVREDNPVFAPQVYFLLLAITMVSSGLAYIGLCTIPECRREREGSTEAAAEDHAHSDFATNSGRAELLAARSDEHTGLFGGSSVKQPLLEDRRRESRDLSLPQGWLPGAFPILLLLAWLSFLQNGVPSILSYACMPYSTRTYHVAQTLSLCVAPVGSLLTLLPSLIPARRSLFALGLAWTLPNIYILAVALHSPNPPLLHAAGGRVLVILSVLISSILIAHSKTAMTILIKASAAAGGHPVKAVMFYAGVSVQVGSCLGALLFFCLVEYTHLFES